MAAGLFVVKILRELGVGKTITLCRQSHGDEHVSSYLFDSMRRGLF